MEWSFASVVHLVERKSCFVNNWNSVPYHWSRLFNEFAQCAMTHERLHMFLKEHYHYVSALLVASNPRLRVWLRRLMCTLQNSPAISVGLLGKRLYHWGIASKQCFYFFIIAPSPRRSHVWAIMLKASPADPARCSISVSEGSPLMCARMRSSIWE